MEIWFKYKLNFADPNELNNEKAMDSMFKVTDLPALDIDQDPQDALKNQRDTFDEADLIDVGN